MLFRSFSFPGRTATPTLNVAPTPTPTLTSEAPTDSSSDDDMLELTEDDEADELLLDGDDILTQPVGSVPVGPPADEEPSLIDETGNPASDEDKPKLAPGGGTLFERMSNIARGAAQAESEDGDAPTFRREPLDIPRFLNRQNNQ